VLRLNPVARVAENYRLNLQNRNEDGVIERQVAVEAKIVRGILDYIGYKNAPFQLMSGAVRVAQTLFYPTDDELHDDLMAYYRQREWRMIPGVAAGGAPNSRPLSEAEKRMLLAIDERFWSRELRDDYGSFRRVDEAHLIERLQGKPVAEGVEAVLVPPAAYDRAATCFGNRVQVIEGLASPA
jgi:hypothetical protein